jgi:hypothetical protein
MNTVEILEEHQDWCKGVEYGERANLSSADLSSVDLSSVDLSSVDLSSANFLVLMLPIWAVYIHKQTVRIGCKHYTHGEWLAFSDSEIDAMDSKALGWWKQYKPVIEAGISALKEVEK